MAVDPWVEEVRVALALNGGVSLAVWMGGCAVELDRARRTRCAWRPGDGAGAGAGDPRPRSVYGALCDAFRRELVVDVMSGSSAGGINGALLAGAMTHGRVLDADYLRDRWLTLGDFSKLLHPLGEREPAALMRGRYFAEELERTFTDLLTQAPADDMPAVVPALDVTATDVAGRSLTFRDAWGGALHGREFRARFRFRRAGDFTAQNLAAAARASASFPLAFEPFRVPPGPPSELAGLDGGSWVIDGGLLDNAPIRAALELIPTRPASRQVRRFLCYLNGEPDPGDAAAGAGGAGHRGDAATGAGGAGHRGDAATGAGGAGHRGDAATAAGGPAAGAAQRGEPPTRDVVGLVINLPRKAPFAEHLLALQSVARRSPLAHEAALSLLSLGLGDLQATATALLASYRRRRRLRALQEMLPEPGDAQRAFDALERAALDLPWLPATLATPADAWPWGFESARRVHHLALDVLRAALPGALEGDREDVLTVRASIDARLQDLEAHRDAFEAAPAVRAAMRALADGGDPAAAVAQLARSAERARAPLAAGIRATAADLYGVSVALGVQAGVPVGASLFGDDWAAPGGLTAGELDCFLARAVAVEVVRRAFADEDAVDTGQEIAFAQITPEAPAPVFSAHPVTAPAAASADAKLCGTILGHFGGFYRRSWRANDFLWGRLDAAARIVEMLVGSHRASAVAATDQDQPWARLARALADGGAEQRALLEEALADLPRPAPPGLPLEERLHNVLAEDLTAGEGRVTRLLCTRAAQFELLCEELRHVAREADDDLRLGCSPATLGLEGLDLTERADVLSAVHRLRASGTTLPAALGRDSEAERTSDLAVRTMTHAGLVSLGVTRRAGGRPATPVTALRSFLLPIAGAVSQHARDRLGVVAAFGGAALYLGARVTRTRATDVVDLDALSLAGLLVTAVALAVVGGTAALPFARARWGAGRRRAIQWALFAALLATGGVGGALLALGPGPLTWSQVLLAPGVDPPWYFTLLPIALGTGAAIVGPRPLRHVVAEVARPAWRGTWSLLLTVAAGALLAGWALSPLRDALSGDGWQQAAAWLAIAATPLALVVVVLAPVLATRAPRA